MTVCVTSFKLATQNLGKWIRECDDVIEKYISVGYEVEISLRPQGIIVSAHEGEFREPRISHQLHCRRIVSWQELSNIKVNTIKYAIEYCIGHIENHYKVGGTD